MIYKEQIDNTRIPHHVAIIMDGNGRWATSQGMERVMGHQKGAQQVHTIMEEAVRLGIDYLTLYTFSTENWNRPEYEVSALMSLLLQHMEEEMFMKNNARFRVIGQIERLPKDIQDAITHLTYVTEHNTSTCLVLALSYSSRWELTNAAQNMAADILAGKLFPKDISDSVINSYLATDFMPEPELLIRTGGEKRLSNFLLWQAAYSELYFSNTYWPDFSKEEFHKAIIDYQSRQRRFGKTEEQVENEQKK